MSGRKVDRHIKRKVTYALAKEEVFDQIVSAEVVLELAEQIEAQRLERDGWDSHRQRHRGRRVVRSIRRAVTRETAAEAEGRNTRDSLRGLAERLRLRRLRQREGAERTECLTRRQTGHVAVLRVRAE